ncbi:MAG: PEP-CTERM sorting domain-containing protein [Rubrivivax sp.]|nr:PEP-CTERM sorting domain-containing protein [Rubrivivax sp.]
MRHLATLAAAVGAAFAVSGAQAAVLILDDFSTPIPGLTIFDTSNAAGSATNVTANPSVYATARTLSHTLLTNAPNSAGFFSSAGTGALPNFLPNQLNMSNGNATDSRVDVLWNLGSIVASTPTSFVIDVISSDPGVTGSMNTIEAFLNGVSLGSQNGMTGAVLSYAVNAAQAASLAAGSTFSFVINGADAWDMAVDNLRLQIPEPTSLALVGLALLGAGVVARRRKA